MEYSIMELHHDEEIFTELIEVTAQWIGLPQVYVEKDYWVTMALRQLSESPLKNEVVFKGGTSLSKAYGLIQRFSEDVDLAVFASGKGDSSRKRLLKSVESFASQGLDYLKHDKRESKGSKFRRTIYQYPRCIENENFGQASPEIVLEVNAFSTPEPFELRALQSLISEEIKP